MHRCPQPHVCGVKNHRDPSNCKVKQRAQARLQAASTMAKANGFAQERQKGEPLNITTAVDRAMFAAFKLRGSNRTPKEDAANRALVREQVKHDVDMALMPSLSDLPRVEGEDFLGDKWSGLALDDDAAITEGIEPGKFALIDRGRGTALYREFDSEKEAQLAYYLYKTHTPYMSDFPSEKEAYHATESIGYAVVGAKLCANDTDLTPSALNAVSRLTQISSEDEQALARRLTKMQVHRDIDIDALPKKSELRVEHGHSTSGMPWTGHMLDQRVAAFKMDDGRWSVVIKDKGVGLPFSCDTFEEAQVAYSLYRAHSEMLRVPANKVEERKAKKAFRYAAFGARMFREGALGR